MHIYLLQQGIGVAVLATDRQASHVRHPLLTPSTCDMQRALTNVCVLVALRWVHGWIDALQETRACIRPKGIKLTGMVDPSDE